MKYLALGVSLLLAMACQEEKVVVPPEDVKTTDIAHFWEAYDQIAATNDSEQQKKALQTLFWDKASTGQEAMFAVRDYTLEDYLKVIKEYPKFWESIRKNTLDVELFAPRLQSGIDSLKKVYPNLRPATIYFTVGALRSNGTTRDSLVLIGSELALADSKTNFEELGKDFSHLKAFFEGNPKDNLVFLNTHEYVHTQQHTTIGNSLLAQTLIEGVAEFVAEKALGTSSPNPQLKFGEEHESEIKRAFSKEMTSPLVSNWFWNTTDNQFGIRDLGYFVGYKICEAHYNQTSNKKLAIKEMIELDYNNQDALWDFVNSSYYFEQPISLYEEVFEMSRPKVLKVYGTKYGRGPISSRTRKISVEFSEPLVTNRISTDYGEMGSEYFPKIEKAEFSNSGKILNYYVRLEPEKEYEMLLHWNMRNKNGIPLQPYSIKFYTGR